jgi:hypothetical protein
VKKIPVEGRAKKTPEGQVMKTPIEGPAKKAPEGEVLKTPVDGRVKKTDASSHQGRRPMTSTP